MNIPDPTISSQENGIRRLIFKTAVIVRKLVIPVFVVILHLVLILTITISVEESRKQADTTIFKMVDVEEYIPPVDPEPEKEEKKEIKREDVVEVPSQPDIAEIIIQTEKEVVETENASDPMEIEYLPQHKISVPPVFPTEQILAKVKYPVLANKQRIEGVVYLELYIDKYGIIRKIVVLKDPGYGLARAAIEALEGITCEPAKANGVPVAVRFRYPIRFKLK
ncbi:MAG: TonB family protein [Spirochaetales bacterium]|nr:TonB family protein [Spirochaetales bacterium]